MRRGKDVLQAEASAIEQIIPLLGEEFSTAVDLILNSGNYLVVVGVGKSGLIGQKIAASFASTGTPSFFMHPTEASHGDLGMLARGCVVLAISNSGESREMRDVLSYARRNEIPVIGITRNVSSTLGRFSEVVLRLPNVPEVCINGMAPTTSTTNTLALGDALVVATMAERNFSREDFAHRHPGGKLGLQLQTLTDWMSLHPHEPPLVRETDDMQSLVMTISDGQNGCAAVVDEDGRMIGMITDGDLRRAMDESFMSKTVADVMVESPYMLNETMLMSEVVKLFTENRISNAFIVRDGKPVGVVHIKSLLLEGYV
ncbi:MAG: KpsF/GutQ family sugar-phosphate isomerase [Alphaproteobacteria bacterium]|nr:KpsF/GutQ family sugar-phosphate isomerase [Alphaproteobacteria bacterium]